MLERAHDMTPLQPDEALYAFLDGELDVVDEQRLFDALASSTELRSEMKDMLAIRNAVHRDVAVPSPALEASLLSAAGLTTTSPGATALISRVPASFWPTAAAAMFAAVTILGSMLLVSQHTEPAIVAVAGGETVPSATVRIDTVERITTPVTTRPTTDDKLRDQLARSERLRAELSNALSAAEATIQLLTDDRQATSALISELQAENAALREENEALAGRLSALDRVIIPTNTTDVHRSTSLGSLREATVARAEALSTAQSSLPVTLRLRSLASGLSSGQSIPSNVTDAILPNTSVAFMVPLAEGHALGLEMGSETFRQQYTGVIGNRLIEYSQTPVLFWMGATYHLSPFEIDIVDGLRPYLDLTAAYAYSQGPLGRASLGLRYQPAGPIAFNLGFDAAALGFQHQNTWFSTTKFGMTYGISIDLGSLR